MGFGQRVSTPSMAATHSAVIDQDAPVDLISFLKAIPDGR